MVHEFAIEWAGLVGRRPVVLARRLGAGDFSVDAGARLGGCALAPVLEVPRAIDAGGRPRGDVFAFQLATADDLPHLPVGRVVSLTGRDVGDAAP